MPGHKINIIVARSQNNVIGYKGITPWGRSLRSDLKHFQKTTERKIVVVGRVTAQSIIAELGKPLPNRRTVVLSTDRTLKIGGCEVYNSPKHIIKLFAKEEMWIIGGGEIYKLFMPYASKMLITEVEYDFEGDTFFPEISDEWNKRILRRVEADEQNNYPFSIVQYTRRPPRL